MNDFVDNSIRDQIITELLTIPDNKVSSLSLILNYFMESRCALIAEARTLNGVAQILESSSVISVLVSIDQWEHIFHLSGTSSFLLFPVQLSTLLQ